MNKDDPACRAFEVSSQEWKVTQFGVGMKDQSLVLVLVSCTATMLKLCFSAVLRTMGSLCQAPPSILIDINLKFVFPIELGSLLVSFPSWDCMRVVCCSACFTVSSLLFTPAIVISCPLPFVGTRQAEACCFVLRDC